MQWQSETINKRAIWEFTRIECMLLCKDDDKLGLNWWINIHHGKIKQGFYTINVKVTREEYKMRHVREMKKRKKKNKDHIGQIKLNVCIHGW